jgi:hypothetical protein
MYKKLVNANPTPIRRALDVSLPYCAMYDMSWVSPRLTAFLYCTRSSPNFTVPASRRCRASPQSLLMCFSYSRYVAAGMLQQFSYIRYVEQLSYMRYVAAVCNVSHDFGHALNWLLSPTKWQHLAGVGLPLHPADAYHPLPPDLTIRGFLGRGCSTGVNLCRCAGF